MIFNVEGWRQTPGVSLEECSHNTKYAACWLDDVAWGMLLHYSSRANVWLDGDLLNG